MYDPKTPYMAEKPPLMQPPMSPGSSLLVDVGGNANSLGYAESPSRTSYTSPVFPPLTAPMMAENSSNHRRSSIKYESPPTGLIRSGSHISAQESLSPKSPVDTDQPSIRDPKILGISTPSSLHSPTGKAPYELSLSQMTIARCEPLDTAPGDVWSNGPPSEQQPCYDLLLPNQRGGKRGPFKTLDLREQTAQTRKIGSCIRCRMQRIRVSVLCHKPTHNDRVSITCWLQILTISA